MSSTNYFSKNLKYIRKKFNLTQEQFAIKTGLTRSSINNYENKISEPNLETIKTIMDKFDITDNIVFDDLQLKNAFDTSSEKEVVKIPVLGVIPAGIPLEAIEDIIDYEEVPKEWLNGNKRYFALKLKGDSMYPKYQTGDVVIFKHQNVFENGDECVVFVNGDDATFKKVFKSENGVTLQPLNHKYDIQTFSKEEVEKLPIKIIGVAFELRRKL